MRRPKLDPLTLPWGGWETLVSTDPCLCLPEHPPLLSRCVLCCVAADHYTCHASVNARPPPIATHPPFNPPPPPPLLHPLIGTHVLARSDFHLCRIQEWRQPCACQLHEEAFSRTLEWKDIYRRIDAALEVPECRREVWVDHHDVSALAPARAHQFRFFSFLL